MTSKTNAIEIINETKMYKKYSNILIPDVVLLIIVINGITTQKIS